MKIINNVTKNVFDLSDEEARRVVLSNRGLFSVIDGNIVFDDIPDEEKTVEDLVKIDLDNMSFAKLKEYCADNAINTQNARSKASLLAVIKKGE